MGVLWRIELLGGLRVVGADRVISRFRTRKAGALLAYLALFPDRAHPRDQLTDLLWPDEVLESGRMKLRSALASLRRQLEPPGTAPGAVITASRLTVTLRAAAITTDAAQFEAALQAAGAAGSPEERAAHLTAAVALYQAPLLPDLHEPWVLPEQHRLSTLFYQALRQRVAHLEQSGQLDAAIDAATRAVAADPLQEEAHEELIRLWRTAGRPDAALRQYRELERILGEELGEAPSLHIRQRVEGVEKAAGVSTTGPPHPPAPRAPAEITASPSAARDTPPVIASRTFVFVQIDGDTPQVQGTPEASSTVVGSHAAPLLRELKRHGGQEIRFALEGERRPAGSVRIAAFASAREALSAALAGMEAFAWAAERGGDGARRRVDRGAPSLALRIALHSGDAVVEGGVYRGPTLQHGVQLVGAASAGQILCSPLTAGLLRGTLRKTDEGEIELLDLGERLLPRMASPERVFQVGSGASHPGQVPTPVPPLPLPVTRFFGREGEVARLCELLVDQRARLVTLTGPGGSGKTRLSVEVAGAARWAYPDEAPRFVPLVDLSNPRQIADAILDALGVSRSPTLSALGQVAEALQGRPTLLVLDNMEHLLADGSEVIRTLLDRVPSLQCLVTSRRLLGLPEEQELPVLPLPTPEAPDRPERLVRFASVQLFVDRVQAVRPDFQVTNANGAAVAELCRRLEGIPLALELAAARARLLSPAEMLRQLAVRFDLLTRRRRTSPARHQSLRAALEWSYQLLSSELQRFFGRLSVFRGGWTPEAAAVVCEEPDALHCLEQLRTSSLVVVDHQEEMNRYRLLETLREYAAEQLSGDGREALDTRHAEYYLALAEMAASERENDHTSIWRERLAREHDNLRAALDWLQQQGRIRDGLRLGAALIWFWEVDGHWAEAVERLVPLVGQADTSDRDETYARVLDGAARLAWRRQDVDVSRRLFTESLAIQRERGDRLGMAHTLFLMGHLFLDQRADLDQADSLYEESQALFEELGDLGGVAGVFYARGLVASFRGDRATTRMFWEKRLEIVRGQADRGGMVDALEPLIELEYGVGEYHRACCYLEERLSISRERAQQDGATLPERTREPWTAGARDGRAVCYLLRECLETESHFAWRPWLAWRRSRLANMMLEQGDFPAAQAECEACLPVFRELDQKDHEGQVLLCLGAIAHWQNRFEEAKAAIEESLSLFRQINCTRMIPEALTELGQLASNQGDYRSARSLLEESLPLAAARPQRAFTLWCLGVLARREGDLPGAFAILEECLRLFREMNYPGDVSLALVALGRLRLEEGCPREAAPLLRESLRLRWPRGDRLGVAECLEALAAVDARRSADGKGCAERAARLFGAAAALREQLGAPIPPADREQYERDVAHVRAAAGGGPFAAAWAEGTKCPLEPMIRSNLSEAAIEQH